MFAALMRGWEQRGLGTAIDVEFVDVIAAIANLDDCYTAVFIY